MSLQSIAQEFLIVPTESEPSPIEVIDHHEPLEVMTDLEQPIEVEIKLDDVPGAKDAKDIELLVEPQDEMIEVHDSEQVDDNDAKNKKSKKNEKWDWKSKGPSGFVAWVKERFDSVPKHSGQDIAGLQRAIAYLEKLDDEISAAMRQDLDGELDANKVEEIRSKIENGINNLQDRVSKIKSSKKRVKKSSASDSEIVKEAQKITGVKGIYVTVPLLIARLGRIIINGKVSAGHDENEMFHKLSKKFSLSLREKAELMSFLEDCGFPLRSDRGYMPDEDVDISSSDNFDWNSNFKG